MPDLPLPDAPIPDARHPGYAWPSWRAALLSAQRGIDGAYEHRRRMFKAANDAGISLADIGETVGLSAAGVHKIVGNSQRSTLDDPAGS